MSILGYLPPIVLALSDDEGFRLRRKAADYLSKNPNLTGAERGSLEEQGFGALAEIVIRSKLELPEINPQDHPVGYDLRLANGLKVDVKCRGGSLPFQEQYESDDAIPREAKHNFFARQVYDASLDADIYVMTHLETPADRTLPGTVRQRKWCLYVCGWVSKERVAREGVFLPRGSLTEQGKTWFTYRGQEIEFYNRNLNGLRTVKDLLAITQSDVDADKRRTGDLNLTSADAVRIVYDLIGRGVLTETHLSFVQQQAKLPIGVKPILHANQYLHLLSWLKHKGAVTNREIQEARNLLHEEPFEGV